MLVPTNPLYHGEDFSFGVWPPGTKATLTNVPWNSGYSDVVSWGKGWRAEALISDYIDRTNDGLSFELEVLTYCRVGQPIRVSVPFNDAIIYNYLRVQNPRQPGENLPTSFYYFVNNVRHIAPNTTELELQLDVWTSFYPYVNLGMAYVERGHVAIADNRSNADNGRYMLAQLEGFDLGSEYITVGVSSKEIARAGGDPNYSVIVYSTVDLEADPGDKSNPKLQTAPGSLFEGLPNGSTPYLMSIDDFSLFMLKAGKYPWITSAISAIYAIPSDCIVMSSLTNPTNRYGAKIYRLYGYSNLVQFEHTLIGNWREFVKPFLGKRYRYLKKFLTYPYCAVEITAHTGTPIVLKPENIAGDNITVTQLSHITQPAPRITFFPKGYNTSDQQIPTSPKSDIPADDNGEFLDMQTGIFDFPSFSLVNNSASLYMAQNRHGINYQFQSAEWSQQKALASNQNSYDNTRLGIDTSRQANNIGNNASARSAHLTALTQGVGVISNLAIGASTGPVGLAAGTLSAANQGVGIASNLMQNSIATGASRQINALETGTQSTINDNNKALADWSANGDYANTIASTNAKLQDARLLQPTVSGQTGGDAFNLALIGWRVTARIKFINIGVLHRIGEYWLRYGYVVTRWLNLPENLMTMTKFTYWKCLDVRVNTSIVPELYRMTIKGILEKGVTVWAKPEEIGKVDFVDNEPISGDYIISDPGL